MRNLFRTVSPANLALLFVGLLDLSTTLFWLRGGHAIEINPIMAGVLRHGIPPFIAVKMCTLLAYVGVMEWYRRRRNPAFARLVGRITLGSYLAIYTLGFCCVNSGLMLG